MWLVPQPGIEPVPPAVEAQSELLESLKKRGGGNGVGVVHKAFLFPGSNKENKCSGQVGGCLCRGGMNSRASVRRDVCS